MECFVKDCKQEPGGRWAIYFPVVNSDKRCNGFVWACKEHKNEKYTYEDWLEGK